MIEARLVTFREYGPWADTLIAKSDALPVWLLNLAVTPYYPDAAKLTLAAYAYADPVCEGLSWHTWVDDYVASLYLRYERRAISWATFLEAAGRQADANGGRHACEYFYEFLNRYEECDFSEALEVRQRDEIAADYHGLIASVRRVYEIFKDYRGTLHSGG
jgi:hypothetical protein